MIGTKSTGSHLLIVLPGALLPGRNPAVEELARRRPVLIVSYDQFQTMHDVLASLEESMVAEGYESADILGTSFGGWVAQCFARATRHRVRKLILSHTFTLSPRDALAFRFGLAMWARIPRRLLLRLVAIRSIRALEPVRKYSAARYEAAVATVRETLAAPSTFDVLMSQNRAMLDSITALVHFPNEQMTHTPVLILESTDDPLISKRARKLLRESFPAASVHSFSGSGHVTALANPEILAGVVEKFLGESSISAPGR